MKYLSLFSGIGGFEYGIEQSNKADQMECVGFSEIDKYAENIYRRHFPDHIGLGDATEIKTEDLPDFDFLVGGFPCQAFSHAGKRRGFSDTRGTLFFEIARILRDKKPKYFLLENVPGLLSHDKGRTFQEILRVLAEEGYDVQWEIINSKDCGVPQNRQRIYLKGFSRERERCGWEVLSQPETNTTTNARQGKTRSTDSEMNTLGIYNKTRSGRVHNPDNIINCITASGQGSGNHQFILEEESDGSVRKIRKVGNIFPSKAQNGHVYDVERLSPTLTRGMYKNGGVIIREEMKTMNGNNSMITFKETDDERQFPCTKNGDFYAITTSQRGMPFIKKQDNYILSRGDTILYRNNTKKGYLEARDGDGLELGQVNGRGMVQDQSIPTLNCSGNAGVLLKDNNYYRIRRLTPVETERLQGFPDNWTKHGADGSLISDTQRYRCCGNAVTTNVITCIMDNWDMVVS